MANYCNGFEKINKPSVSSVFGSEIVQLNVGGGLYTTSRATLIRYPDSMLGAMFSGMFPTARDSEGRFFIDRDGSTFGHILNFLRCGQLVLPSDFSQLDLLAVEADFYRLDPLIDAIAQLRASRNCCGSFVEVMNIENTAKLYLCKFHGSFERYHFNSHEFERSLWYLPQFSSNRYF
jgi:BTB/POZ domain